ncbi:MAG: nuclear transport factor 2 family protein [Gemmatimonadota bacterium]|nr:MAG: nuclear transport factor 2 family protein [Gemmatimonadota bacterium]
MAYEPTALRDASVLQNGSVRNTAEAALQCARSIACCGFVLGCSGASESGGATTASVRDAERVVCDCLQACNAHDIRGALRAVAPDFVWVDVVGDLVCVGVRGTEALWEGRTSYCGRFPGARSEIEDLVALGS